MFIQAIESKYMIYLSSSPFFIINPGIGTHVYVSTIIAHNLDSLISLKQFTIFPYLPNIARNLEKLFAYSNFIYFQIQIIETVCLGTI